MRKFLRNKERGLRIIEGGENERNGPDLHELQIKKETEGICRALLFQERNERGALNMPQLFEFLSAANFLCSFFETAGVLSGFGIEFDHIASFHKQRHLRNSSSFKRNCFRASL